MLSLGHPRWVTAETTVTACGHSVLIIRKTHSTENAVAKRQERTNRTRACTGEYIYIHTHTQQRTYTVLPRGGTRHKSEDNLKSCAVGSRHSDLPSSYMDIYIHALVNEIHGYTSAMITTQSQLQPLIARTTYASCDYSRNAQFRTVTS